MGKEIAISFLVPTLGEREVETRRLLNSLKEQTNSSFEVVFVVQSYFDEMETVIKDYSDLEISMVKSERGLSRARNVGMKHCKGRIIVLSDDDCWYPDDAVDILLSNLDDSTDVLFSQIYDKINDKLYKSYNEEHSTIKSRFSLSSKSSIEIAFKNKFINNLFDERFGLGSGQFVCCEEVDFLISLFNMGAKMKYIPIVTVYHERKYSGSTEKQVVAKGALYAKHYNWFIGLLICIKDLLLAHENNIISFFRGYSLYRKMK